MDTDITIGQQLVCGETTAVVYVALVDADGHPHHFTLGIDEADELAEQLGAAVVAA